VLIFSRPIAISYPTALEPELRVILEAAQEIGVSTIFITSQTRSQLTSAKVRTNFDHNSGNPIGVCIDVATSNGTARTSSLSAFLSEVPENLTIWTDAVAAKLLFTGAKVIGVQLLDGRKGDQSCLISCY
jgi:hypothetical protein